jgi:hypothetical protein
MPTGCPSNKRFGSIPKQFLSRIAHSDLTAELRLERKSSKERLSSITPPETVFDDITFSLSGEIVTLGRFTNLPARAKDSERARPYP